MPAPLPHRPPLLSHHVSNALHCLSLAQVVSILDKEVDKHADAQGAEYLESFTGRRKRLTLEDVKRIDKRRAREARPEANDVTVVQQLLARLQELGENNPVLFHQEQRLDPAGDSAGLCAGRGRPVWSQDAGGLWVRACQGCAA
jgi:hypothetical protein